MNPIETFANRYEKRSHYTALNYRSILNNYFKTIKKDPEHYFDKPNNDEIQKDIETYWNTIIDRPPQTRNVRIYCIKSFMVRNGIELKTIFYKELRENAEERGTLTEDYIPKAEEIKKILQHANIRDKSWILLAMSSGMRIGEITKIDKDDVHLDQDPPYIFLPANITKNKHKRFTFCSDEAREALTEWLRIRSEYITKINGKNNLPRVMTKTHNINDKRLFPFSYITLMNKWNSITDTIKLGKTNKDKRTKRRKLHIHCLRKYAKTHMLFSMNESKVNFIIGHNTYLSQEYNKFEKEDIAPDYTEAMKNLMIFETSPDLTEVHKEIVDLQKKLLEKDEQINKMGNQILMILTEKEIKRK